MNNMNCHKCQNNKFYIEEIKSCKNCKHNGIYINRIDDYVHCECQTDIQRTQADDTGYCQIGYSGNQGCYKITCTNCSAVFNIPNNIDK